MKARDEVQITRVANGWIVRPVHSPGLPINLEEMYVFGTYRQMEYWLLCHFVHRNEKHQYKAKAQ